MRRLTILLLILLAAGCTSRERRKAVADSAASTWEAADALEQSDNPKVRAACIAIIKLQSCGLIKAMGFTYAPAGVTDDE